MYSKVKDLRQEEDKWLCTVEVWYNCYCSHQKIEVAIQQEERPSKLQIIEVTKELLKK